MDETLESRLAAVERAVTDAETPIEPLEDAAAVEERLTALETTVADLETTVVELDAAIQAVRGYAGAIRAVNEEVETRAELALTKVEALERGHDPVEQDVIERNWTEGSVGEQGLAENDANEQRSATQLDADSRSIRDESAPDASESGGSSLFARLRDVL